MGRFRPRAHLPTLKKSVDLAAMQAVRLLAIASIAHTGLTGAEEEPMYPLLRNIRGTAHVTLAVATLTSLMTIGPLAASQPCTTRYYLSPIIGTGTEQDPFRPAIGDFPNATHKTFAFGYAAIVPSYVPSWTFVLVASTNHNPLIHQPDFGPLPDIPLETSVQDMQASDREMIQETLSRFELDPAILDAAATYLDVIQAIVVAVDPNLPNFDPSGLFVACTL